MELTCASLDDIRGILPHLTERLSDFNLFLLKGDLGAGKTTLVQQWLKSLSVEEDVSSPTFSIINEYHSTTGRVFYHMDMYRLKEPVEALNIGLEDYLRQEDAVIIIEWPEVILDLLDPPFVFLEITLEGDVRRIHLKEIHSS